MSEETTNPTETTVTPPATTPATPPAAPTGKTFSEDYVQTLREEAKTNRIAKKAAEAKLKTLLGLKDDEDIDDAKITAFQAKHQVELSTALQKANARLISAEIKSLEGYDAKLVERLLDKSKLNISDDGTVTGLKEAVAELEKEFPQIKLTAPATPGANPPGADTLTEAQRLQADYDAAMKSGNLAAAIAIKNKMFLSPKK